MLAQQRRRCPAAVAEVEVLADHDEPRRQAVDEDLLHEVLRRLAAPGPGRTGHEAVSTPVAASSSSLWSRAVSSSGADSGPHDLGGVGVEGDDGGEQVMGPSLAAQRGQDVLVATVDPVEDADREGGGAGGAASAVGVTDDLQASLVGARPVVRWSAPNLPDPR